MPMSAAERVRRRNMRIQRAHEMRAKKAKAKKLAEQQKANAATAIDENQSRVANKSASVVSFTTPSKLLPPHIQRAHKMRAERARKALQESAPKPMPTRDTAVPTNNFNTLQKYSSVPLPCSHKSKRRETMSGTSERNLIVCLETQIQEAVSRQEYEKAARLKRELEQTKRIAEVKAAASMEKHALLSARPGTEAFQNELAQLQASHEAAMRGLRQDLEDAKKRDRTHVEVMGNCMQNIKAMEAELGILRAENAHLKSSGADGDMNALRLEVEALKTANTSLKKKEDEVAALTQQTSELAAQLAAAKDEIERLKASSALSLREIQRLTSKRNSEAAQVVVRPHDSDHQDNAASATQLSKTTNTVNEREQRQNVVTPVRVSKEKDSSDCSALQNRNVESVPPLPSNENTKLPLTDVPLPTLDTENTKKTSNPPAFTTRHEKLSACPHCNRTFRASVLKKHIKVCIHAPGKKQKKTFDASAARAKALAQQNGVDIKLVKRLAKRAAKARTPAKVSNWRQKSAELREAMLWARGIDPSTVKKKKNNSKAPKHNEAPNHNKAPKHNNAPKPQMTECKPASSNFPRRKVPRSRLSDNRPNPKSMRAVPRSRVRSSHTLRQTVRHTSSQQMPTQVWSGQQEW